MYFKKKSLYLFLITIALWFFASFLRYNKNLDKFYQRDDRRPYAAIFALVEKWSTELSNSINDDLIDIEWIKFIPSYHNIDTVNRWYDNVLEYQNPRLALYVWVTEHLLIQDFFFISRIFFLFSLFILIWSFINHFFWLNNKALSYFLWLIAIILSSTLFMWSNLLINNLYAILFLFSSLVCYFVYQKKWLSLFFLIILVLNRQEYLLFFVLWLVIYILLRSKLSRFFLIFTILWLWLGFYLLFLHEIFYNYFIDLDDWVAKMSMQLLWYIFDIRDFSILKRNVNNFFIKIFPLYALMIPVILIWFVNFKKSLKDKLILMLILVSIFIFYYFLKNQDFQWYQTWWILWSYSRYILIVYILASILIIKLILSLSSRILKIFTMSLVTIIWVLSSASSYHKMKWFIRSYEWVKSKINYVWEADFLQSWEYPIIIDGTEWCYFWMDLHSFDSICLWELFDSKKSLFILDKLLSDYKYKNIYMVESRDGWYRKGKHDLANKFKNSWKVELLRIDTSWWWYNRPLLYKISF